MKKAVMYGAGNIGRGFIGATFSASGYSVSYIDVNEAVVNMLNERGEYPVRILYGNDYKDTIVKPVSGVNGRVQADITKAITEADLMATAVGVNILKFIAEPIALALIGRWEAGVTAPLNIIICENLIGADSYLKGLIAEKMNDEQKALLDERVGFVEASIGRMVPVQTPEMQDGDPLRVCVESYCALPVDRDAFKGEIPAIVNLVPFSPFEYYIDRKLFVHNMGHAMTAYLGSLKGCSYIYEAIEDPYIELAVMRAMTESTVALSKKFGVDFYELNVHVEDLLRRFANAQLRDTVARVGNDIRRKLNPNDRIVGAMKLCIEQGVEPVHICLAAAAAMHFSHDELSKLPFEEKLTTLAQIDVDSTEGQLIRRFYDALSNGESVCSILKTIKDVRRKPNV